MKTDAWEGAAICNKTEKSNCEGGFVKVTRRGREGTMKKKDGNVNSGVITIPRYDYNAPAALLRHSHTGFLVTCSIQREKSATLEAISILSKYVRSCNNSSESCETDTNSTPNSKRRKVSDPETERAECYEQHKPQCDILTEFQETGASSKDDFASHPNNADTSVQSDSINLSLVKLARSGLLLLTFPAENSPETVAIVSDIFQSLESGSLKSPLSWCHRIFPIQATCRLEEKELRAVVSKLVLQFVKDKQDKLAKPIKFAVGYNRRGLDEMQNTAKDASEESDGVVSLLDRGKCFEVVASAVKDVISDSAVDLKTPELCILVELLPLSRLPKGSSVAAVSVLPKNLVSIKPRLCIKPLACNTNAKAS